MSELIATYGLQGGSKLLIEQTDYAPYAGKVTKYAMAVLLGNLIYGREDRIPVDCGFDGSQVVTGIMVYPKTPGLQFTMQLSYGGLSEPVVEESEQEEIINLLLNGSASLKYPASSLTSVEWLGDIYDKDFNLRSAPPIALGGDGIKIGGKVYGAVRVRYRSTRYSYIASIPRRDETSSNKYSSVAFGVYSGGVDWLELSAPPGADELTGDCGWGGKVIIDPYEPPPGEPPVGGANRTIEVDYCSQNIVGNTVTAI